MANQKQRKARVSNVTPEEKAIQDKLDALTKQIGDKPATDAQKKQRADLRGELAPLRFKRVAKARVTKALKMIDGIGSLSGSGYSSTEEQREKIIAALSEAVESVKTRLSGVAPTTAAFDL